jgi:hypothetical protein
MRRYQLIAGRSRWAALAVAVTAVVSLFMATAGAQAVVVSDQGVTAGVAMLPGTTAPAGLPVTSSGACNDPAMAFTPYLAYLPNSNQLCDRGGAVMHSNETFALTWDPLRRYWSGTRGYVEQFMRDVADGSGSLTSPYAVTTQYTDTSNTHAGNSSIYGGGCIDYGNPTGSGNSNTTCQFGATFATGPGNNYPNPENCATSGNSYTFSPAFSANDVCLTDGDIRRELQNIVPQTGMLTHVQAYHTPLVTVFLPPRAEVCLDTNNTLCSANSDSTVVKGQFCSYHSQVQMPDGTMVAYVVQPWTPYTGCDEPKLPPLGSNPTPEDVAKDAGSRLVSPTSAGQIAAITDPAMNAWVANSGLEINDNWNCMPYGADIDTVPVGSRSYAIQREFNNAAAISFDPNTYFGCAPDVLLNPNFVVPSAVDPGDVVVFDGSSTDSTLIVPNDKYVWDFGDGTGAVGPSVVHSYAKGGNFLVKLTVTDRGGNVATVTQSISVLGFNGLPVPPSNAPSGNPSNVGKSALGLKVRMQLLPQSLRSVLKRGISARLSANEPANGIAYVYVSRAVAKRRHLKGSVSRLGVLVARGTVASIKSGTMGLAFRLSHSTSARLKGLRHVKLTVRLTLNAGGANRTVVTAAGLY